MKKLSFMRVLSIVLSLILTLSLLPANVLAATEVKDADGHWAASAIETCNTYGVMSGDSKGNYKPDADITRAEFAAMVNRAFGYDALNVPALSDYTDVPGNAWYAGDMRTAIALGILTGYGGGIAAPEDKITREQATVVFTKILRLNPVSSGASTRFTDIGEASEWARSAVQTMEASGYISGFGNKFMPKKNLTRSEAAQMLVNVFGVIVDSSFDAQGKTYQNVTIRKPGIALKNANIKGDLFITEGVGDGDVWLDTVKIDKRLLAAGGGQNSIHVKDITVGENVVVDKPNAAGSEPVRFRAIQSSDNTIIFEGTAREIIVTEDIIIIIDNDGEKTVFNMFAPAGEASKPSVTIAENAVVDKVTTFVPAEIKGGGDVGKIEVHTNGVTVDAAVNVKPENVEAESGVEVNMGGETKTGEGITDPTPKPEPSTPDPTPTPPPSTGGSSGGNSGGSSTPTLGGTASITGTNKIGETLTVDTSHITGGSGAFSYQWKSDGVNIGTNSATYIIQTADLGKVITCVVTRSGTSGSITATGAKVPYTVNITNTGVATGDTAVTLSSGMGVAGASITLNYVLGSSGTNTNTLTFSGGTGLTNLTSAGQSTSQTYTVNAADATNGIITITAAFTHTSNDALAITITGPSTTLTPIEAASPSYSERSATFTVAVSGFSNDADANNVGLTITGVAGLTFSDYDITGNASSGTKTFTVTAAYNGTQAFSTGAATISVTGLSGIPSGYAYNGGTKTANVNIIDGQSDFAGGVEEIDRRIPVNSTNIKAFNTYAGTTAGLTRHYKQTEPVTLNTVSAGQSNWTTIGKSSSSLFKGSFNGQNNAISNLTIGVDGFYEGMFYAIDNTGTVKNLNLTNVSIKGDLFAGGIAAENSGTVTNCAISGTVTGSDSSSMSAYMTLGVGGVVGQNDNGTVKDCSFSGAVSGVNEVGGVVGHNAPYQNASLVQNCHSSGTVSGGNSVGGVAGRNGTEDFYGSSAEGTVENCYSTSAITGTGDNTGGVVGFNELGTVQYCYATGSVGGGDCTGGVVGLNYYNAVMQNSYATGDVSGSYYVGGVAGQSYDNAVLQNCYAAGSVEGVNSVGGVVGNHYGGTAANCVALNESVVATSSSASVGRVAGYFDSSYATLASNYAWGGMTVTKNGTEVTPANSAAGIDGANLSAANMKTDTWWKNTSNWNITAPASAWDFTGTWKWTTDKIPHLCTDDLWDWPIYLIDDPNEGMDGTVSKPFKVYNEATLKKVGTETGSGWTLSAYYEQTADITLIAPQSPNTSNFTPIGTFIGSYDGNNHTVTGLTIDSTASNQGLFATIGTVGVVKDLNLTSVSVSGTYYIGGVAGYNYGKIQNCSVAGSVASTHASYGYVGGVTGFNTNTVEDCEVSVTVTASSYPAGGVVAYNQSGEIKNCVFNGSASGDSSIGGIVGYALNGDITDCTVTGSVSANSNGDSIGGVVGTLYTGVVADCSFDGNVVGFSSVGGIVGWNTDYDAAKLGNAQGTVKRCYASGTVSTNATGTGGGTSIGGLVGRSNIKSVIEDCYSTCNVTGKMSTGGLVGLNYGMIEHCYTSGTVSGGTAGGLVGSNSSDNTTGLFGTIKNCVALNISVSGGADYSVARVAASFGSPAVLADNYAWKDMPLIYNTSDNKTAVPEEDGKDGADITDLAALWTTLGFTDSWWNGKLPTVLPTSMALPLAFSITATVTIENGILPDGETSGEFGLGETVTVTATPDEGWTFAYWQDENGEIVSYDAEYTFIVTGDTMLTAVCVESDTAILQEENTQTEPEDGDETNPNDIPRKEPEDIYLPKDDDEDGTPDPENDGGDDGNSDNDDNSSDNDNGGGEHDSDNGNNTNKDGNVSGGDADGGSQADPIETLNSLVKLGALGQITVREAIATMNAL